VFGSDPDFLLSVVGSSMKNPSFSSPKLVPDPHFKDQESVSGVPTVLKNRLVNHVPMRFMAFNPPGAKPLFSSDWKVYFKFPCTECLGVCPPTLASCALVIFAHTLRRKWFSL